MHHESRWLFEKTEAVAAGGMVAAKHPLAARAGAEMLRRGGNAVDAAVAAAFASGVVEPWMSGIGGGGYTVIQMASGEAVVIDGSFVAPAAARPDMYPPGGQRPPDDLFPWPPVRDDLNLHGWQSVAVPGFVAGMTRALERFGQLDLPTVLGPAIQLAADGFPVGWYGTLKIAQDAPLIARYPETARIFFRQGFPRQPGDRLVQPELAETLRKLARGGADAFYRGEIAAAIVRASRQHGGLLTADDLAAAEALEVSPLTFDYRGHRVHTVPGLSGGITLAQILATLDGFDLHSLGHNSAAALHLLAEASKLAFADRYAHLGDGRPHGWLVEPAYIAAVRGKVDPQRAAARPVPGTPPTGSTTHLCAADRDGNLVSCTQTLLSIFGSRVTVPGTGILLNNGMYWFNPEPGHPNCPGPRKRPLCNMAPLVVSRGGRPVLALGASGGRKIINCNVQAAINVIDYGMGIQAALAAPRIDLSTGALLADDRIARATLRALERIRHQVRAVEQTIAPAQFAIPTGILVDEASGLLRGGVDPFHTAHAAGVH